MVDFPIQQFVIVKLALKLKTDASTTVSVYAANWPLNVNDGSADYYVVDLVKSIGGLGVEVGEFSSKDGSSNINFDCPLSSIGYQRRLVDFFDKYTPINQLATIYYYENQQAPNNVYELESNFTQVFQGYIKELKFDESACRMSVNATNEFTEYANYIIPSFPGIFSDTAAGSVLPLLIGETVEVKPKLMVEQTNSLLAGVGGIMYPDLHQGSAIYGTGTARVNDSGSAWTSDGNAGGLTNGVINIKDKAGIYQEIYTAPSNYTVYDHTSATTNAAAISSGNVYMQQMQAIDFSNGSDFGFIFAFTGVYFRMKYQAAVSSGNYIVGIHESPRTDEINLKPLMSFNYDYTNITSSYTDHYWYFTEPLVVNPDYTYYFSINNGCDQSILLENTNEAHSSRQVIIYNSTNLFIVNSYLYDRLLKGKFYAITYKTNFYRYYNHGNYYELPIKRGKSFHYLEVTSLSTSVTDYSKLDIVANIEGYNDGAGTFYDTPVSAAKYLMRTYDDSSLTWDDSNLFDDDYFSDSHDALDDYPRVFNGAINRLSTVKTAIDTLCSESISKFIYKNDAWGIYTHGVSLANSFYLYDKDIIDFSFEIKTRSTVLNYIRAAYKQNLKVPNYTNIFLDDRWYSYVYDMIVGYNDGGIGQVISSEAKELFGVIEKAVNTFDVVTDETSIENVLTLYLMLHKLPREFVDVTVPYMQFKDIEIMDVGRIESAYLPAQFGSTYAPNDYVAVNTGGDNIECDIIGETGITRAQGVDVQVWKKEIVLTKKKEPATMKLTLKVNNHHGGIY